MYFHLARSCSGLYFGRVKKLRLMDVSLVDVFAVVFVRAKTRREKSMFLPFISVLLGRFILNHLIQNKNSLSSSSLQK